MKYRFIDSILCVCVCVSVCVRLHLFLPTYRITKRAMAEPTSSLENLADDALDNTDFGNKYNEENKSAANGKEGKDGEGTALASEAATPPMDGDAADGAAEEEEDAAADNAEEEEETDFQGVLGGLDASGRGMWNLSGDAGGQFGGFKMQDRTPQELEEEAAQQQQMWVAYVEELSGALDRRSNLAVVDSGAAEGKDGGEGGAEGSNEAKDTKPLTLFELCEQFENVQTILAENVDIDDEQCGLSEDLLAVLKRLLPKFKVVLGETPKLHVPGKPSATDGEASGAADPVEAVGSLPSDLVTTCGELKPRCGILRVKVAGMLAELLRFRAESLDQEVVDLGLLPMLIDLFFKYDCNNILHNAVASCAITALEGQHVPLQESLLVKCNLLERIMEAWEDNDADKAKDKSRGRPYMGALTQISTVVNNVAAAGDKSFVSEHVSGNKAWDSFVETQLKVLLELHARQIGGPPPQAMAMHEEIDQGDIWNNLAKILSSFRGASGGEDGDFGSLDLAKLMALGGLTGDNAEEDEDDDFDDDENLSDLTANIGHVTALEQNAAGSSEGNSKSDDGPVTNMRHLFP